MALVYGIELVSREADQYVIPMVDKDTGDTFFLRRTRQNPKAIYTLWIDADGKPITFEDREMAQQCIATYFKGTPAEVRQIYV